MWLRRSLYSVLALILAGLLLLAACGEEEPTEPIGPSTGEPQYGGILEVSHKGLGTNIGNPREGGLGAGWIAGCALQTLLTIDENGELAPRLATDWEFSDDALHLTLYLRQGVKFHDDTPFNADAVKYNFDMKMDLPFHPELNIVESVEVIDNYTVRLNLTEFKSYFINELTWAAGTMFSPTALETKDDEWLVANPVGTGPFKIKEFEPEVYIEYEKWDGYWEEGKPYLDGMSQTVIADQTVLLMSFQSGEFDATIGLDNRDIPGLVVAPYNCGVYGVPQVTVVMVPDSIHPDSPYYDIRVRRAVAHALPLSEVPGMVGYGTLLTNQIALPADWSWAYNPNVKGYPYDPEKAKELLAEAGYPNGFKTTLQWPDIAEPELAAAIQGWLRAIDIDAQLYAPTFGAHLQVAWAEEYDNTLMYYFNQTDPGRHPIQSLQTSYTPDGAWSSKSMIYTDEFVELVNQAIVEPDATKQKQMIWRMQEILIDELCLTIPVFINAGNFVYYPHVHANWWQNSSHQWNPEDAWIEPK